MSTTFSAFRGPRRAAAATAAMAVAGLLAACSSTGGSTPGASGSGSGTPSATPSSVSSFGAAGGPVDEIKWGLPYGEPNTLDPVNGAYYSASMVSMNMCEALLRLGNDFSVSPGLATLTQPDPKTIKLALTPGVTFWDGSALTPDDVVWSLDHARDPASVVSFLFSAVDSVKATGPQEVTIALKQADSLIPLELATFAGAVQQRAFSQKAGKNLGAAGTGVMCTGPFKFGEWTAGRDITLLRNDTYWDKARAAKAAKVTLSFVTDSAALAQSLATGELDGAYEIPAAVIPKLRKTDGGNLVFGSPSQLYLTASALNIQGALAKPEMRKALFMTIDRTAVAQAIFQGAAQPSWTSMNPDSWDNAATPPEARKIWQDAYDGFAAQRKAWGSATAIADAKKLATAAGYAGAPIVLATLAGDATQSQIAQLWQAGAKQAGINVQIKQLQSIDYSSATTDPKKREGLDVLLASSFNGAPTALEPMLFVYLPDSFFNYSGYSDDKVTAAIAAARATTDPVEQARKLVEAQSIYEEAYVETALLQYDEIAFLNKRLSGMTTSFAYLNQASLATIGAAG